MPMSHLPRGRRICAIAALQGLAVILASAAEPAPANAIKRLSFNAANASDPDYAYVSLESRYAGAFRIPGEFYDSLQADPAYSWNYAHGPMAIDGQVLYLAGKAEGSGAGRIGAVNIPALVNSRSLDALNQATVAQIPSTQCCYGPNDSYWASNGQGMWIAGLYATDGEILMSGMIFYDQFTVHNQTHFQVFSNKGSLSGSTIRGWYQGLVTAAGTTVSDNGNYGGWFAPIPGYLQADMQGDMLTGWTSSTFRAGIHAASSGPSLLVFRKADLISATSTVELKRALHYFPKENAINGQFSNLDNRDGTNTIWTHVSEASYGCIIEGTYTYAVFGFSAGNGPQGCAYKGTMNNGVYVDGWAPKDAADQYPFVWLFDVRDMFNAIATGADPSTIMPYEWRALTATEVPFQPSTNVGRGLGASKIGGGHYDPATGRLWLSLADADNHGSIFSTPIIIAYDGLRFPDGGSPGNAIPVAVDQSVSTPRDVALPVLLQASDADGDPLTFAIATPPAHGTLSSNSGPSRTYTPAAGFTGSDAFTFTATDGSADSNLATVSITITAPGGASPGSTAKAGGGGCGLGAASGLICGLGLLIHRRRRG